MIAGDDEGTSSLARDLSAIRAATLFHHLQHVSPPKAARESTSARCICGICFSGGTTRHRRGALRYYAGSHSFVRAQRLRDYNFAVGAPVQTRAFEGNGRSRAALATRL